jgi:transposase-like protein
MELVNARSPEEILSQEGLLKDLTKRLVERALQGEMTVHLGYEKHAPEGRNMR